MRRIKQPAPWLLILTLLAVTGLTGCGKVNVGYAPVTGCANVDLDPANCPR